VHRQRRPSAYPQGYRSAWRWARTPEVQLSNRLSTLPAGPVPSDIRAADMRAAFAFAFALALPLAAGRKKVLDTANHNHHKNAFPRSGTCIAGTTNSQALRLHSAGAEALRIGVELCIGTALCIGMELHIAVELHIVVPYSLVRSASRA